MMSIDPRSKRGGSKSARKGGISTRTGRTPLRGDAQSHATDSYRSRSGSRGGRATQSRGQSTRSRRHRSAQSGDVGRDGAWGDDPMNWDQQSYLSMDQTQNLNVVAQSGGRMNVSEYDTSSSPRPCFQGPVGGPGAAARRGPRRATPRRLDPTAGPGPAIAADVSPRFRPRSSK